MTREECIEKIRHIQKSMYTFIFEDGLSHKFKADDADKFYYYLDMIVKYLDEDVPKEQEPKTGRWIKYGIPRCGEQHYKCTSCGYYINFGQWGELYTKEFKYCPNCGARMEGAE